MAGQAGDGSAGGVWNTVRDSQVGTVIQTGGIFMPRAWATPRQLPRAPTGFVGRERELAVLTDAENPIFTVTGPGGVGKTALALHWAHRHASEYPDGQLYVDLHGFSPRGERTSTYAALRGLVQSLGVDPVPDQQDTLAAVYRSEIADKKMLVMLDNAAHIEQVVPLLPGSANCTVLVTSRNSLPGLTTRYGALPVRLDVLAESEARALLGTWRAEAAVTALLTACGGLPLALTIVAGHLSLHPELTASDLVSELDESATRLEGLDSVSPDGFLRVALSWSYDALTPRQREAFALLGIAPGPDISLAAASRLLDLTAREAQRLLATLDGASLVRHDGHGRYRMHDLVREYAADTAPGLAGADDAMRRLLDFYLHTALEADRLLHPQRRLPGLMPLTPTSGDLRDATAALAWFDAQHPHLLAAQRTAAGLLLHSTTFHLAWALSTYHQRGAYRSDRLTVWNAALDAAEQWDRPAARIRAHRHLGHAYADVRELEISFKQLEFALALAQEHGDTVQEAHTHRALSSWWECYLDHSPALHHAQRALGHYRDLGRQADEATALNQVGWCWAFLGKFDAAREWCEAALALHRRCRNVEGEALTLDSLGWIARASGHYELAVSYYKRALAMHRSLSSPRSVANTLDRLGVAHKTEQQYGEARKVWQEARGIYADIDARRAEQVGRQLAWIDSRA
ncbi:ATP-binding protein [Actinokineospora terrae]|uniref:Predicted ATPase n=1 Tax=Actinokineospora terrae TaxID=155974 RepID=A0A1H9X3J3_9PSEU|nr:tetratricopeptide repeat protein [Actinokineospora terrae]SES40457.1 Predicted ATPase [Actinokineospora terrae]